MNPLRRSARRLRKRAGAHAPGLAAPSLSDPGGAPAVRFNTRFEERLNGTGAGDEQVGAPTLEAVPEEERPDIRPRLRELLAWYEEVLGRIDSGATIRWATGRMPRWRSWRQTSSSAASS